MWKDYSTYDCSTEAELDVLYELYKLNELDEFLYYSGFYSLFSEHAVLLYMFERFLNLSF